MKCKYCNEEMPERGNFCPMCGGDNSIEPEIIVDPADLSFGEEELTADELAQEVEALVEEDGEAEVIVTPDGDEEAEEVPMGPSPELKKARFVAAMTGCIAALAVLAVVLFAGISGNFSEDGKGWDIGSLFDWMIPRDNSLHYKDSYTVSDKKAMKKRQDVVATVSGGELTNGELQIYYWTQVYDFLNNNSYMLHSLGLDYTSPLDEQMAYTSNDDTWQQYFLEGALDMWHSNIAFAMMAKEKGFQLDAEYRTELENMRAEMEADALKNGYASAEEMLQDSMGPGCTMDDYIAYMETYFLGYSYFADQYSNIDPTLEEIDAYFEANKAALAEKNIAKDGTYKVDVRHILIKIEELKAEEGGADAQAEGDTSTEDNKLVNGYTQAAWDACYAKANEILNQWLAGDKTEDSFAELAKTHSADGNAKDGGIYTGVAKGQMKEDFNGWCFDEVRKEGDYGIVRTEYGYHIIYFISREDVWVTQTRAQMISETAKKIVSETLAAYPMEVNYKKIVLGEVDLG